MRRRGKRRREPSRQMECHARVLASASAFVHRRRTDLHGGRDVGQGETLQVRQQAVGDHRRLGGAGGSGRNWRRPKNKQRMKSS